MLSQQQHTSTMDHQQQRRQSRPTGPRLAMFEETQLPQRPTTAPLTQGHSFVPLAMGVQDARMVGLTNQGQIQQHYLQVAQQQRQALPGQQQHPNLAVPLTAEQYRTLRHSQLDAELNSAFMGNQMSPQRPMPTPAQAFQGLGISSMMPTDSAIGMPGYGYLNPMAITSPKRKPMPLTPPMQTTNFFPTTPEDTPFCRVIDFSPIRAPLELPKQIDARRESDAQQASSGLQIIVTEPTKDSEDLLHFNKIKAEQNVSLLPSPPNTAPIPTVSTFVPGPALHGGPGPALRIGGSIDATPFDLFTELVDVDANTSPMTSPQLSSAAASPRTMAMDYSPIANMNIPMQAPVMDLSHSFQLFNNSAANFGPWDATSRPDSSPRSNSLTDMDAIVEETGISAEEVQAYIEEPDVARGGKWKCLYPGCEKLFGRKENIRSHVQTHLGDRQYKCLHCNKCFVRQHDLKRHSKIHSGVKPYPCRCGNTFARHDALTRHRQRGICDGGLPGVVKKPVKRGRPRKERPNNEDRADKAARTRLHAAERSGSESAESDEEMGSTTSSAHGSPTQGSTARGSPLMYDNLDMSPLQQENVETVQEQPLTFDPAVFSTTPSMSDYSTGNTPPTRLRASISDATLTPHELGLPLEQDASLGMTASDIALFPSSENNVMIENTPELTLGSPSTGMTDMDFNNSNFNSSELSQSMTFPDLPSADSLALFGASQLLDGSMQDPSWDANFLDFSTTDDKSLHMFDEQAVFADTP